MRVIKARQVPCRDRIVATYGTCSASASEAKTLRTQALLQQPDQLIYTLYSYALCVKSVAECPSPAFASPSASARKHQSSPTAASIRRGSLALWPRNRKCARFGQRLPVMIWTDRHQHTAIFLRYHLIGVLGCLYPLGYPRI